MVGWCFPLMSTQYVPLLQSEEASRLKFQTGISSSLLWPHTSFGAGSINTRFEFFGFETAVL